MNPLRLRASNYRTFQTVELELPSGCVAVLGENGAGKSSLVNVIDLALFGPDGRSWAPYLTQGGDGIGLELELVFEHGGRDYRVRRGWSSAGKGKTTLDFERALGESAESFPGRHGPTNALGWQASSRESIDQTQALIEETIGLSRETFRASSMLVQGDGAAFTEASPRDRKRILAKILGLERFDRYLDLARRDIREAEGEIAGGRRLIEAGERELQRKPDVDLRLKTAADTVEAAGKDLAEAEGWLSTTAQTIARADELRAARAAAIAEELRAKAALAPIMERVGSADQAERDRAVALEELDTLATDEQIAELERRKAELEQALEGYRHALQRRAELVKTAELRQVEKDALVARLNVVTGKIERLEESIEKVETGDLETCPTCRQALGVDGRHATLSSLRGEIEVAKDERRALLEQIVAVDVPEIPAPPDPPVIAGASVEALLADAVNRLTKAKQDEIQRARLAERIRQLDEIAKARPAAGEVETANRGLLQAIAAVKTLGPTISDGDYDRLKAEALRHRARIDEERARLTAASADQVRAETELERLRQVAEETDRHRAAIAEEQGRLDVLKILERAYGRDGIPALIVSQAAIPAIELEAGRILAELGTSYRVELRTEKILAGGGIADALDVVIVTETGERPYETFSGGERTRLNLSLRIGLARLLAARRGAESRLLAIDEPEFLDQAGTAALANVLRGLTGDFDKVYLISHVPELRDAFDQTIDVVKDGSGYSKIGGP